MREKQMFAGASCAGVVSAGVACFFVGLVMIIWCVWDSYKGIDVTKIQNGFSTIFIATLFIWFWGWSFLYSVWRFRPIKRAAAYRVAGLLLLAGVMITFAGMIHLSIY